MLQQQSTAFVATCAPRFDNASRERSVYCLKPSITSGLHRKDMPHSTDFGDGRRLVTRQYCRRASPRSACVVVKIESQPTTVGGSIR
jgi:hypothetical protein